MEHPLPSQGNPVLGKTITHTQPRTGTQLRTHFLMALNFEAGKNFSAHDLSGLEDTMVIWPSLGAEDGEGSQNPKRKMSRYSH